ncbi:MAG: LutC/YkgG family protein [Streptosporangiaceae bacterium]
MTAREEVLARIRAAIGNAQPDTKAAAVGYRTSSELGPAELIAVLTDRLRDYGAAVRTCTPDELGAAVGTALAERGARRVVLPPGLDLPVLAGIESVTDDGLSAEELDTFDGVVTMAAAAIAETGTIVLDGSPGQGRRALSLVPDYHLCVLRSDQVVGLVPEAVALLDPARPVRGGSGGSPPRLAQTWVSGPSATSDIELDRVEGVHGPRTLEVIIVGAGPAKATSG